MIKVQFFASIREALATDGLVVDCADHVATVNDLVDYLAQKNPEWAHILLGERVLVAVNQEMTHAGARVLEGDEVAFFPPVTGG